MQINQEINKRKEKPEKDGWTTRVDQSNYQILPYHDKNGTGKGKHG